MERTFKLKKNGSPVNFGDQIMYIINANLSEGRGYNSLKLMTVTEKNIDQLIKEGVIVETTPKSSEFTINVTTYKQLISEELLQAGLLDEKSQNTFINDLINVDPIIAFRLLLGILSRHMLGEDVPKDVYYAIDICTLRIFTKEVDPNMMFGKIAFFKKEEDAATALLVIWTLYPELKAYFNASDK